MSTCSIVFTAGTGTDASSWCISLRMSDATPAGSVCARTTTCISRNGNWASAKKTAGWAGCVSEVFFNVAPTTPTTSAELSLRHPAAERTDDLGKHKEPLADRALAWPESMREFGVDDHTCRRVRPIGGVEVATGHQRHSQRLKVSFVHREVLHLGLVAGTWSRLVGREQADTR